MFFIRRKNNQVEKIIDEVYQKDTIKRYIMLLVGCLIAAVSFNLFFLRYNIVCFGVSGISIVLKEFGVDPSSFILIANIFLLIISYIFLDIKDVKNQIIGAILYPIFIKITLPLTNMIDFGNIEMIIIAVFGGLTHGLGSGLIYKSGFSTGGTDVVGLLIKKYSKTTMGNAMMYVNIVIIFIGKLVFSWEIFMYAILVAYLIAVSTDKILLGISNSKAFYIVADKEKEEIIKEFLNSLPNVGCTIMDVNSGNNNKKSLLLAVVPTKSYFIIKEGLKEIDRDIFYLVCDSYQVVHKDDLYE